MNTFTAKETQEEIKKKIIANPLFRLVSYNYKPATFFVISHTLKENLFVEYENTFMFMHSLGNKNRTMVYVLNKDIDELLSDIEYGQTKIDKNFILKLLANGSVDNISLRDKMYILGCCFGYPRAACEIFAEECGTDSRILGLRDDRISVRSTTLGFGIISYKKEKRLHKEVKDLIEFYEAVIEC